MTAATDSHARGALFVISAPSGAGKTSLVRAVLDRDPLVHVSISHTTRRRRPSETDGINYHFVDRARFEAMLAEDAFLESADVFGNYYGTSAEWVDAELDAGRDVILEIDWQGAAQVRRQRPDTRCIFILPPSMATLEERLRLRGEDDDEVIARRLAAAREEMSHHVEFDDIVINELFDDAVEDLASLFRAARLGIDRQTRAHSAMIQALLAH
ncbi:MAG TPA: guanylate kinase [Pseudomonadales bacterium]|nr:guanylate kinase [Pseudomonadales bacterium]